MTDLIENTKSDSHKEYTVVVGVAISTFLDSSPLGMICVFWRRPDRPGQAALCFEFPTV